MKAVILNGSNNDKNLLNKVEEITVKELRKNNWEVKNFELRNKNIATCTGCFRCWIKTPGQCIINDEGREITKTVARSDLLILLSPITFGGYSYNLKKIIDRLIPNLLPFFTKINGEIHHKYRYEKSPKLLAIGYLPKHDEESEKIFKMLLSRNALNMNSPANYTEIITSNESNFNADKFIKILNEMMQ